MRAARSDSTETISASRVIAKTRWATVLGDDTTAVPPRASTALIAWTSALIPLESMNEIPARSITTPDRPAATQIRHAHRELVHADDLELTDELDEGDALDRERDIDRQRLRQGLAHSALLFEVGRTLPAVPSTVRSSQHN